MYIYIYGKEEYPALETLIRNKLKKKKMERGAEAFSVFFFVFLVRLGVLLGCFLAQKQQEVLIVRFIKNIEDRM